MNPDVIKALEDDIRAVHERFMAAMEQRLPAMQVETKERYFVVLTSLVGKLEAREKNLRDILQEMMSEAASLIFDEMSRG